MANLSADAAKRLMVATASKTAGLEVVDAVNDASALVAAQPATKTHTLVASIVATNVSQTVDFGVLAVGDMVAMIPATAGNADAIGPIAVAGTLGQAAVVGNLYLVTRAYTFTNPAADTSTF